MNRNIFTTEAFADWCDKQGDAAYEWTSGNRCAITQYARAVGGDHLYASISDIPWGARCVETAAREYPWTFKALAERLRSEGPAS